MVILHKVYYNIIIFNKLLLRSRDELRLLEPGMQLIINSCFENKYMTEELLNFLFIYCSEYDPSLNEEIRNSVKYCFIDFQESGLILYNFFFFC